MDTTILHRINEDFAGYLTEASRADLANRRSGPSGLQLYEEVMVQLFHLATEIEGQNSRHLRIPELLGPVDVARLTAAPASADFGGSLALSFRSLARRVEQDFADTAGMGMLDLYGRQTYSMSTATRRLALLLDVD